MKIGIILGTRPEIIKLYSIITFCEKNHENYFLIHTNQHYSKNMDKIFFEELELPKPKYNLNIGSGTHGKQTGLMLQKIEKVLLEEKPTHIIIQGDTNSTLAGALAASKLNIKVCHVEAGLRSYDREMPEEINRIITDHISDYLFCPTNKQKEILLTEGIPENKIYVTGNTIVDAIYLIKEKLDNSIIKKKNLVEKEYIFITMHRPSNVDKKKTLSKQLENISNIAKEYNLKTIFPIHPRTQNNIKKFNINIPKNIFIINPVGFKDLLTLELNAKIILTDSGGIQEEACILKIPSINLRENTERPECVEVGASKIVGSDYRLLKEGFIYFQKNVDWNNPFGSGVAGEKIIKILQRDEK
jgi:UDP-N-acetylglucosamine 2-epimerase (non-hydrolysing)